MNFALPFARGELIAVYDADSVPTPDQLRRIAAAFALAPKTVACLQTQLAYYNRNENWLTRQCAVEYAYLFKLLFPRLAQFGSPLLFTGVSAHYRTATLRQAAAFDAHNMARDSGLSVRLARMGFRTALVPMITREEAPCRFRDWMAQRVRWVKGVLQTAIVNMRSPVKMWRELGGRNFLLTQALTREHRCPSDAGYRGGQPSLAIPAGALWTSCVFRLHGGHGFCHQGHIVSRPQCVLGDDNSDRTPLLADDLGRYLAGDAAIFHRGAALGEDAAWHVADEASGRREEAEGVSHENNSDYPVHIGLPDGLARSRLDRAGQWLLPLPRRKLHDQPDGLDLLGHHPCRGRTGRTYRLAEIGKVDLLMSANGSG